MLGRFFAPRSWHSKVYSGREKSQGRGGIRAVKIAIGKIPFCHPREEEREERKPLLLLSRRRKKPQGKRGVFRTVEVRKNAPNRRFHK